MPRKNNKDKGRRNEVSRYPSRTPRPKPVVDFTIDQLHAANVELLRRYVTEQGKILPRKYTGLPAPFQRRLSRSIKQARQMLLMK
ncbi:MAG: 30S ribosomal protein S18 [Verrucomicrobiales bacterium]|jgi:small subunit ribosomal protein S18|nr:30S ribosomal protein S18 [Pedosphaera sp.]MEC7904899.1 30S ribosomal protein S18 [Verrucomicrobiota bacterium]HBF02751.1 30S ribosomal protein S18 [Verrucomicrobiales bacterium]MAN32197.1 30S ribosomal protein S18 [Pedosphaera sp.]MEC8718837.1 30S ribosomal protein S18 [Verrucomicrobiota bacterium]|tara:strand:- start:34 stop:288 length:255 start_codon:yes stop_codon:yes gene_type:complete